MQFQQIIQKRASNPLFTKGELVLSLRRSSTTKASIANLLKRAVERKDLFRLKSGIYCLPEKYRSRLISPYEFLGKIDPFSYVTDRTALSYLGFIPEAIGMITAFSDKAIQLQKPFKTEIGTFNILKVPRHFLMFGVDSINLPQGIEYRMATPLKAILDHAYLTKKEWNNRQHLIRDLRLNEDLLEKNINWHDLENYKKQYNAPFINQVCKKLHE